MMDKTLDRDLINKIINVNDYNFFKIMQAICSEDDELYPISDIDLYKIILNDTLVTPINVNNKVYRELPDDLADDELENLTNTDCVILKDKYQNYRVFTPHTFEDYHSYCIDGNNLEYIIEMLDMYLEVNSSHYEKVETVLNLFN